MKDKNKSVNEHIIIKQYYVFIKRDLTRNGFVGGGERGGDGKVNSI